LLINDNSPIGEFVFCDAERGMKKTWRLLANIKEDVDNEHQG